MTTTAPTTTCTVRMSEGLCGQPAVTTFTGHYGQVYAECAEHAPASAPRTVETSAAAHPPTRTTRPYVLVAHGEIVGYADARTPAVEKRAARLGARIVPVRR